jgi:RNA polymerase sigma factor (sigma-70 family)
VDAAAQSLQPPAGAPDRSIGDLLAGLASRNPSAAWTGFLQGFSPVILQIVRRCESNPGRVEDCFQQVCEALSDNGFRRLLSYRPNGPATFRTWLMAVTANLCVDWRRRKRGRIRPIRAVAQLPELEQLVYRYIYVRGLPRIECLRLLQARHPGLTEPQLSDINARLFALLTPQQRWQLGTRMATGPPSDESTLALDDGALQLEEPGPGPEELAESAQERGRLDAALAQLRPRERLLLRLRYEQNLTLAEVARLTGLHDPFRANRQIQAALAALAQFMNPPVSDHGRKSQ